jgi:XRE family transcriptional regulator, regulator of sulfur utilization
MKLGERLRELRQQRGLTLLQLFHETSLSVSYLSDLERGRTNPSIDTLTCIAKGYRISIGELVAGVDGWQTPEQEGLAPGLEKLLEQGVIDLAIAQDLSRIELCGRRLQTDIEWLELYLHLKTLMRPYSMD